MNKRQNILDKTIRLIESANPSNVHNSIELLDDILAHLAMLPNVELRVDMDNDRQIIVGGDLVAFVSYRPSLGTVLYGKYQLINKLRGVKYHEQ